MLGYVVLENHVHFIASGEDLAKEVGDFKSYTARRIIDHLSERRVQTLLDGLAYHKVRHKTDRAYQLWQEGSQPKMIETEAMLRQKLEYIHNNPVKRGYVSDPRHWRYSSARNYARMESLVDRDNRLVTRGMETTQSVEDGIPTRSVGTSCGNGGRRWEACLSAPAGEEELVPTLRVGMPRVTLRVNLSTSIHSIIM